METYLNLVERVIRTGEKKKPSRPGLPSTLELFGERMVFENVGERFPLLTTKKMSIKNILVELTWFLKGRTDLSYLTERGVHIWDMDAMKYYNDIGFKIESISDVFNKANIVGDLGKIYGKQWREWGEDKFDQIENLITSLKKNPYSRYHIVTAWDPTIFLHYRNMAALPSCHILFQCNVVEVNGKKRLDLSILQRSCDLMLGVPYNIASYAALLIILAKMTNMTPGNLIWFGNSVHIYENHVENAKVQLSRVPRESPKLILKKDLNDMKDLNGLEDLDFELVGYYPYNKLDFELNVGV